MIDDDASSPLLVVEIHPTFVGEPAIIFFALDFVLQIGVMTPIPLGLLQVRSEHHHHTFARVERILYLSERILFKVVGLIVAFEVSIEIGRPRPVEGA